MPYQLQYDKDRRQFGIRLYERVNRDDIQNALQDMFTHSTWTSGVNVIWDGTGITEFLLEADDFGLIRTVFKQQAGTPGSGKAAIVVQRAMHVSIAQLFQVLLKSPDRQIRIFDSLEEAEHWIGIQ